MKEINSFSRRAMVKSSVFGLLGVSMVNVGFAREAFYIRASANEIDQPHDRYPSIKLEVASEVVGVSHFNLDRLKELVDPRPELSRASWEGGFGDWEAAIDAASHVGRRDIAEYLISKGAVPTIFTYAMLGNYELVKSMIDNTRGIQQKLGPHGLTLMHHAKLGLTIEGVSKINAQKLVDYLQQLGDADGRTYLPVEESEKEKYLGDYVYDKEKNAGFTVKLNMRKMLSLGKLGKSGGSLHRIGEHEFTYNGSHSVKIIFKIENNKAVGLKIIEPGLELTAIKV